MAQTTINKIILWLLASISSIASYVAVVQNNRVVDLKEAKAKSEEYYQKQIDQKDILLTREREKKDSLQGIIVLRSDKSFEELKNILDIKNNNSTITIKPKKK